MASTSTPWSIPYPVGTDRVMDGDNAMQAIADRLHLLLNQNITKAAVSTATTPIGTWTAGGSMVYFRAGWTQLFIDTVKASWGAAEGVLTIPSGYRPTLFNVYGAVIVRDTGAITGVYASVDGALRTLVAGSGGGLIGYLIWPQPT